MSIFAVIGATGRTGGATARALLARGHTVRALTRDPGSDPAAALARLGAEAARADMDDVGSLVAAFDGADGVFSVQPAFDARGRHRADEERTQGLNVARALGEAGVLHVVYSSAGTGAPGSGVPHFDVKLEIEAALRAACPSVTVLRPAPFMELLVDPSFAPPLSTWGVEPKVVGWDTALPWVAVRDVGSAAATALRRPEEFGGREVFLSADAASLREARAAYREAAGRPPRRVPLPVWAFRAIAGDEMVRMWAYMRDDPSMAAFDRSPLHAMVPEALTLEDWLRGWFG